MTHLQTLLNDIEVEAAEKSAAACANAALVELAGDICARINAAAERDACFPTWHLDSLRPCVTLQRDVNTSEGDFISAIEAAGYSIEQMPAWIATRDAAGMPSHVYLMIAPGVDILLHTLPHRADAALALQEAA